MEKVKQLPESHEALVKLNNFPTEFLLQREIQVEAALKAFEDNYRVSVMVKTSCKNKIVDDFEVIRDDAI